MHGRLSLVQRGQSLPQRGPFLAKSRHLQMEYIADHLDKVSAVSNEELLCLLSPHFSRVRLQPDGDLVRRDDFLAFLDRLRADEISGDLLFSK